MASHDKDMRGKAFYWFQAVVGEEYRLILDNRDILIRHDGIQDVDETPSVVYGINEAEHTDYLHVVDEFNDADADLTDGVKAPVFADDARTFCGRAVPMNSAGDRVLVVQAMLHNAMVLVQIGDVNSAK